MNLGLIDLSLNLTIHRYGEHDLQTVRVWSWEKPRQETQKYWIVYIHGGAWRDPRIDSATFLPTIAALLDRKQPDVISWVAGFASIDYRLSPHPSFPQNIETQAIKLRHAKHPEHIQDVHSAINLLESIYKFGNNFILVGHSCGATLAFQYIMGREVALPTRESQERKENTYPEPVGILGVAGIYDLRLLVDNHLTVPEYRRFIEGAFGEDKLLWDLVSPARFGKFDLTWKIGKVALLGHSTEDELIEEHQVDVMRRLLASTANRLKLMVAKDLNGEHDELWHTECLAGLIEAMIRGLENVEN